MVLVAICFMQTVSRAAIIIEVLNIEATATIIKDNKFSQK